MRDVSFGQYYPSKSVIHDLDPRAKILLLFAYIVIVFCTFSYASIITLAISTVLIMLLSGVPIKSYFKSLKVVITIVIITSILNLFYGTGDPIWQWWVLKITLNGINRAFFVVMRIICLIISSSALTFTTSPTELTDAIERLMKPLAKIKVPVHEIAMMMSLALRFVPTLLDETDRLMQAQKARGADFETGSIINKVKAILPILVPLFVSAFSRAFELATAMECRCYNGGEGRTRMKVIKMSKKDFFAFMFIFIVIGGVILCNLKFPKVI